MRHLLSITKALSDPGRLRLLAALREGELCVCQLWELLDLAPSTVSRHLSLLAAAGLVESRKVGRWAFYRLAETEATPESRAAMDWLMPILATQPAVATDDERRRRIQSMSAAELAELQARGLRCCEMPTVDDCCASPDGEATEPSNDHAATRG